MSRQLKHLDQLLRLRLHNPRRNVTSGDYSPKAASLIKGEIDRLTLLLHRTFVCNVSSYKLNSDRFSLPSEN